MHLDFLKTIIWLEVYIYFLKLVCYIFFLSSYEKSKL